MAKIIKKVKVGKNQPVNISAPNNNALKAKADRIYQPVVGNMVVQDKYGNVVDAGFSAVELQNTLEGLQEQIGTLDNLTTTNKADLVSAINELDSDIGNLNNLTTTAKNNVVAAINEVDSDISTINTTIGNKNNLATTATNLVGAINEVKGIADSAASSASTAYHFKGTKATYNALNALPSSDNQIGDVWNVGSNLNGGNYAWTGSAWDKLGDTVDLSGYYTIEECDENFATKDEATKDFAGLMSGEDKDFVDQLKEWKEKVDSEIGLASVDIDTEDLTASEIRIAEGEAKAIQTAAEEKLARDNHIPIYIDNQKVGVKFYVDPEYSKVYTITDNSVTLPSKSIIEKGGTYTAKLTDNRTYHVTYSETKVILRHYKKRLNKSTELKKAKVNGATVSIGRTVSISGLNKGIYFFHYLNGAYTLNVYNSSDIANLINGVTPAPTPVATITKNGNSGTFTLGTDENLITYTVTYNASGIPTRVSYNRYDANNTKVFLKTDSTVEIADIEYAIDYDTTNDVLTSLTLSASDKENGVYGRFDNLPWKTLTFAASNLSDAYDVNNKTVNIYANTENSSGDAIIYWCNTFEDGYTPTNTKADKDHLAANKQLQLLAFSRTSGTITIRPWIKNTTTYTHKAIELVGTDVSDGGFRMIICKGYWNLIRINFTYGLGLPNNSSIHFPGLVTVSDAAELNFKGCNINIRRRYTKSPTDYYKESTGASSIRVITASDSSTYNFTSTQNDASEPYRYILTDDLADQTIVKSGTTLYDNTERNDHFISNLRYNISTEHYSKLYNKGYNIDIDLSKDIFGDTSSLADIDLSSSKYGMPFIRIENSSLIVMVNAGETEFTIGGKKKSLLNSRFYVDVSGKFETYFAALINSGLRTQGTGRPQLFVRKVNEDNAISNNGFKSNVLFLRNILIANSTDSSIEGNYYIHVANGKNHDLYPLFIAPGKALPSGVTVDDVVYVSVYDHTEFTGTSTLRPKYLGMYRMVKNEGTFTTTANTGYWQSSITPITITSANWSTEKTKYKVANENAEIPELFENKTFYIKYVASNYDNTNDSTPNNFFNTNGKMYNIATASFAYVSRPDYFPGTYVKNDDIDSATFAWYK